MTDLKKYLDDNNFRQPYLKYAYNYISQNGEDGIIKQLLSELEICNGNVMEFGAWDGIYLCNVYLLYKTGKFNAILVESDKKRYENLLTNTKNLKNVETHNVMISPDSKNKNSVDNIVKNSRFNIKNDNFTILVIDVDSIDYAIFDSIKNYSPIIIIIECKNGTKITDDYIGNDGASLKSITELATRKNYTLVCYNLNAFFVNNNYIHKLKSHNPNLKLKDYDAPIKELQHIDQTGNIKNNRYYFTEEYKQICKKEASELLSL